MSATNNFAALFLQSGRHSIVTLQFVILLSERQIYGSQNFAKSKKETD